MKTLNITTIIFYLTFEAAVVIGALLSLFFIGPSFAMHYLYPLKPHNAQYINAFIIVIFGLSNALPAGVVFGASLGFWGVFRPGFKAFLIGIGAVTLIAFYFALVIPWDTFRQTWLNTWINVVEAVIFVSVFVVVTKKVSRLTTNMNVLIKRICSVVILLVFFGIFWERVKFFL